MEFSFDDWSFKNIWRVVEAEERREKNENKLKLFDAMDAYPKSMKVNRNLVMEKYLAGIDVSNVPAVRQPRAL